MSNRPPDDLTPRERRMVNIVKVALGVAFVLLVVGASYWIDL